MREIFGSLSENCIPATSQLRKPTTTVHNTSLRWLEETTKTTRSSAIAVIADRTACSILTLFIVIATSRPLNKKICSLSVRGSNNYCGSASAIHSPHTSTAPAVAPFTWRFTVGCVSLLTNEPCLFDSHMCVAWVHYRHLWRFSLPFLWCIWWLNDTSYSKSVWRDK